MTSGRGFVELDQLAEVVRAGFGPERRLVRATRLPGGSKKGVHRLTLDDGSTAILYVWDEADNYWPSEDGDGGVDPFADASGLDHFTAAHAALEALKVRTPRVHLIDGSGTRYPADLALVEDVGATTLETLLDRDPHEAENTLAKLAESLNTMHGNRRPELGQVTTAARGRSCEQIVLDRALAHLAQSAPRVERLAEAREQLELALRELAAGVRPRAEHRLVHGELGPDHVLVDERGDPVIIDIEGLMFFDVEWEHAFLRLRFGEHYGPLHRDDLDEHRLRFYGLAMHLSLVAGPLRLLDGDFPDREPMRGIMEHNLERVLELLRA